MKKSNHSTKRTSRNDIPGNSRNIKNYYKSYANSIQGNIASAQQLLKIRCQLRTRIKVGLKVARGDGNPY